MKSSSGPINLSSSTIVRFFLVAALFVGLYMIRDVILVLLTSIVIASFIESASKSFAKVGIKRTFSVVFIYLVSFLFILGVFYVFVPVLIGELTSFSSFIREYLPSSSFLGNFNTGTISGAKDIVSSISNNASLGDVIGSAQNFAGNFSSGLFQTTSAVFGGIFNFVLIVIISFYLSMHENGIESFLRVIAPDKHEAYIVSLWKRTERKIGLWVQGQMLLGVIVGMLVYLGLTIIGVEYALLIAIITALSELIPFGMILAAAPAIFFAYVDGGISLSAIVLLFYFIIQQFENYLLQPLIVKRVIGISPLVVILSLIIGAKLAGFWGIILAIPAAVFVFEYLSDIEKEKSERKKSTV
ncbi:AI-2E family transporter [Candidatus Nomurabacteria bacterium]|nr:AI-2E family transporter [Candidatus Nomurabacteria bacterium]USN94594.1 MAG: AI-2E family transporter [Candidatus Nomurabacteria bacterium]